MTPASFPASLSESCDLYMRDTFINLSIEQQQQMAEHIREAFSFCAEFCIEYILSATAIPNDRRCNPCPYLSDLHNQVQLLRAQALHMNGWLSSSAVAS